ncbi:uncharacterized mitochondrial protein AtMg00820-like [Cornus florida]|uniref:uncharacterized mitochondrial protein AtMg00820-like n=1 Tax=Cornus florida TaxID=4283 RepID=UPI00289CBB61|nr:uncharacterized mitochondrial protein AtMg00820-like [Cornus florida]
MVTRLRDGILKEKNIHSMVTTKHPLPQAFASLLHTTDIELTCYTNAAHSPEWCQAMTDEFNALLKKGTWSLVPLSSSHTPVGCKWVFKIKRHSDGRIEHYKAHLVAKEFHQQLGLDYDETLSPVVKPTTIRTVVIPLGSEIRVGGWVVVSWHAGVVACLGWPGWRDAERLREVECSGGE